MLRVDGYKYLSLSLSLTLMFSNPIFHNDWESQQEIWTFQIIENDVIKLKKRFDII